MTEFLRHFFGLCGEAHPNILNIFLYSTPIVYIGIKIKSYLTSFKHQNHDEVS